MPIEEELKAFERSIVLDIPTAVSLGDGAKALDVAHQIIEKVDRSPSLLSGLTIFISLQALPAIMRFQLTFTSVR